MMGALPFDAETVFRWRVGRQEVAAQAIGAFQTPFGTRAVLQDTAECHWLAAVSEDGQLTEILCGPVTGEQALRAAEHIIAGIQDHGSVSGLVNILALGLVVRS